MVCCMKCSFGNALKVHVAFVGCGLFILPSYLCMPSTISYCWIYFGFYMLVCVVSDIWRGTILIKICSVFSFLISLVADPSSPLYLIVSCGKFRVFRASFEFFRLFVFFFLHDHFF